MDYKIVVTVDAEEDLDKYIRYLLYTISRNDLRGRLKLVCLLCIDKFYKKVYTKYIPNRKELLYASASKRMGK